MRIWTCLLLSFSLAMDAFAVALCQGVTKREKPLLIALTTGAAFGFFQGLMPALGYLLGSRLSALLAAFDHLIAFLLLAILGIRMIIESRREETLPKKSGFDLRELLTLSLATSIDAWSVGVPLALMRVSILPVAGCIALITAVLSFSGVLLGRCFGNRFHKKATLAGGILLLLLGVKILLSAFFPALGF